MASPDALSDSSSDAPPASSKLAALERKQLQKMKSLDQSSGVIRVYISPRDVCVLARVSKLVEPVRAVMIEKLGLGPSEALSVAAALASESGALSACDDLPESRSDHALVTLTLDQLRILWTLGFCRDDNGDPIISDDGYLMCPQGSEPSSAPPFAGSALEDTSSSGSWMGPGFGVPSNASIGGVLLASHLALGSKPYLGDMAKAAIGSGAPYLAGAVALGLGGKFAYDSFRGGKDIDKVSSEESHRLAHAAQSASHAKSHEAMRKEILDKSQEAYKDSQTEARLKGERRDHQVDYSLGSPTTGAAPLRTRSKKNADELLQVGTTRGDLSRLAYPRLKAPQSAGRLRAREASFTNAESKFRKLFEGPLRQEMDNLVNRLKPILRQLDSTGDLESGVEDVDVGARTIRKRADTVAEALRDHHVRTAFAGDASSVQSRNPNPETLNKLFRTITGTPRDTSFRKSLGLHAVATSSGVDRKRIEIENKRLMDEAELFVHYSSMLWAAATVASAVHAIKSPPPGSSQDATLIDAGIVTLETDLGLEVWSQGWEERFGDVFGRSASGSHRVARSALDAYAKTHSTSIHTEAQRLFERSLQEGTPFAKELTRTAVAMGGKHLTLETLTKRAKAVASHLETGGEGLDAAFDTNLAMNALYRMGEELSNEFDSILVERDSVAGSMLDILSQLVWLVDALHKLEKAQAQAETPGGESIAQRMHQVIEDDKGIADLVTREHLRMAQLAAKRRGGPDTVSDAIKERGRSARVERTLVSPDAKKTKSDQSAWHCSSKRGFPARNSYCVQVNGTSSREAFGDKEVTCRVDDNKGRKRPLTEEFLKAEKAAGRTHPKETTCDALNSS